MRKYTLALSIAAHVVAACAALFSTVLATGELPEPRRASVFVEVFPSPHPTLPPAARTQPVKAMPRPDLAPLEAPNGVTPEPDLPSADFDRPDALTSGVVFGDPAATAAAIVDPPPPSAGPSGPVRVGGVIHAPQKIVHVAPVYPSIARSAHVSGVVILEATIGEDGTVRDVKVLRSIPLLDDAAKGAVLRWRFTPTLLNGQPVPVLMTVTVAFTLD